MKAKVIGMAAALVLAGWMAGTARANEPAPYSVTAIPVPPGYASFRPGGLNNAGVVVGSIQPVSGYDQVGIWSGGEATSLGTFGRTVAWATGINANGQVIGMSQQKTGPEVTSYYNEGFLLQNGNVTFLGMLGSGYGSFAGDINDAGQIVGTSSNGTLDLDGNWVYRGFLWENGILKDIGVPSGPYVRVFPTAINSGGVVAGWTDQTGSVTSGAGFLWSKANSFEIMPNQLGTGRMTPKDINDSGHVVGNYETTPYGTPGSQSKPFYYDGANMVELPQLPGAATTYAMAINNSDEIVGGGVLSGVSVPVLWDNGKVYNINDLVPTGFGPFDYPSSVRLNNQGQILLAKVLPTGGLQGFILTPIPEPATLSLLALGGLAVIRRRRAK